MTQRNNHTMTEKAWRTCTNPERMLDAVRGTVGHRKLRLFACHCCRKVAPMLGAACLKALEVAEQFADGRADRKLLEAARIAAFDAYYQCKPRIKKWAAEAVEYACSAPEHMAEDATYTARLAWLMADVGVARPLIKAARRAASLAQCHLLREMIGAPSPLAPVQASCLAWNDGAVRKVAKLVYDDHAFDRLPLLADALEDAGCDRLDVLEHCRSGGAHVRGCWAVDLILNKT